MAHSQQILRVAATAVKIMKTRLVIMMTEVKARKEYPFGEFTELLHLGLDVATDFFLHVCS